MVLEDIEINVLADDFYRKLKESHIEICLWYLELAERMKDAQQDHHGRYEECGKYLSATRSFLEFLGNSVDETITITYREYLILRNPYQVNPW